MFRENIFGVVSSALFGIRVGREMAVVFESLQDEKSPLFPKI